jgi:serine/threonine protein kinase/tetratricopeptide (TPR) repeat protein
VGAATTATEAAPRKTRIAGRYRVERLLGVGGMGEVHEVYDEAGGRTLALKRLLPAANKTQRALFEREFHTLASLKHPNIIEVYDFGVADDSPYYTMELLAGGDLRDRAPMHWAEACRCLRDVASTLGLLHARRLLHRDLSPRNVWRNQDGSIKLLDFGALASFGLPRDVTGTAAFIAPEALRSEPLDQRADLYMIGALGYWLLTGQLAYGARQLSDLYEAWKIPPAPVSTRIAALARADLPEPPAELDALIESLLSQTPQGRPGSTADVVDALGELAGLSRASTESAAQGYIHSKAFVGRERERDQLVTHLNTAASGVGSSFVFESLPGVGRSRLLSELALTARLSGASVLSASGGGFDGIYGLARGLAHALLDALPDEARASARAHASVLGHLSPELHARLSEPPVRLAVLSEATGERRVRTQAALRDWFLEVSRTRLLVIAIDDLELADDSSLAFLAALADSAKSHKLLLLGTLPGGAIELNAPLQTLRQLSTRVRLSPLTLPETNELFRSVFDDVPHLSRLSERLFRVSQGNPAYCMELAEHLVHSGVVRYAEGGWLLPAELFDGQLPKSRDAALLARLSRLPGDVRKLAQVLSVELGVFTRDTCIALSELSREETGRALEVLCAEAVLNESPGGFRFGHALLRETLDGELDAERRKRAHAILGQQLLRQGSLDVVGQLEAGLHLMRGGHEERGAAMVVQAANVMTGADALTFAVPSLSAALALFRVQGRSKHEQLVILGRLATAAYYVDRRLAPYGHEAMTLMEDVFGLSHARKLRPYLGKKLSVILVVLWTAIGFRLRKKNPLVPPFREAMSLFLQAVTTMVGVAIVCIDPDRATRYANLLEPFTGLGPNHVTTLVYEYCMGLAATVRDRPHDAWQRWQRLLTRLLSKEPIVGMPEDVRKLYTGGALYASGVLECWRDSSRALEYAEQLSKLDMGMYEMSADQLRMLYYANQGKLERSEHYRQRVEMHAIQRGSAWQVETWAPGAFIGVYLRTNDALSMKRSLEDLKRLSKELPTLHTYVRRSAGSYLLLRGKYAEALTALDDCLREEPLSIVGWARSHGSLARAYNQLGEHGRAREICERALERLEPEDLAFTALNLMLQTEHALARAKLGQHEQAAADIEHLLSRHASNQGPLTMGALNEARARLALIANDPALAADYLLKMEGWYHPTGIPTLIQRCARLAKELRAQAGQEVVSGTYDTTYASSTMERLFSEVMGVTQCAERVLSLIANDQSEAYLFLPEADGATLAARSQNAAPSEALLRWVETRLRQALENENTVVVEDGASVLSANLLSIGDKTYQIALLYAADSYKDMVVGAAVTLHGRDSQALSGSTLSALAMQLYKVMGAH